MKPFTKQQVDAVLNAKTEAEKVKAAATAMIETPMELIRAILLKHEQAVIEVLRELSAEKELAVAAEREKVARWQIGAGYSTGHGDTIEDLLVELEWQVREAEREVIAQWVGDMCKGLDHKTIAMAIRNGGNDSRMPSRSN